MLRKLRFPTISFADRRDVLLMTAATLVVFAITAVWGVFLAGTGIFRNQNLSGYILLLLFLGAGGAVGAFPFVTGWDREKGQARARMVVRIGIALQLFSVLASLVGLFYATDTTRSVPVGFATFTAMMLGLILAGFAGNLLAPKQV